VQSDQSTNNGGETPLPGPAAPSTTPNLNNGSSVDTSKNTPADTIKRPLPLGQTPPQKIESKVDAKGSPPPLPPPKQPPPPNAKTGVPPGGTADRTSSDRTSPEPPPKRIKRHSSVRANPQNSPAGFWWKALLAIGAVVCMAATGWALREFRSQSDAKDLANEKAAPVSPKQLSDDQLLYEVLDRADQERRTAELLDSLEEDETGKDTDAEDTVNTTEDNVELKNGSDASDSSSHDSAVVPASHNAEITPEDDTTPTEITPPIVAAPVTTPRISIPLAPELLKAEEEMQRVYRDEFRNDDPGSMALTVEMLLVDAQAEGVTDADRYLRYQKAFEMALEANATTAADEAYRLLTTEFKTDSLSLRTTMIEKLAEQTRQTSEYWRLGNEALAHANLLIDHRQYGESEKMIEIAANFGLRVSAPRLRVAAKEAELEIERLRSLEQMQRDAESLLARDPGHALGNLNRGLFLCFVIGHWETGLSHLQRAEIPELTAAATLELATPTELADRLAVADAWYDLADSDKRFESFFARADAWYRLTLPYLEIAQARDVKKRMKVIERKRFSERMVRLCEVSS